MPGIIEIIDRHGKRRRAKPHEVLADGESFSMQMQFLDEQVHDHLVAKFNQHVVVDGSGTKAGHRPGFLLMSDQAADDAAAVAYDERSKRMQSAWRRGNEPDESEAPDPSPTLNQVPEEQRSLAAYEARNKRLRNGWKQR